MRKVFEFFGLVKPKPAPKPPKWVRAAVHMADGRTVVHHGRSVSVADGNLSIFSSPGGSGNIVAIYAPGVWHSFSIGHRIIQHYNLER